MSAFTPRHHRVEPGGSPGPPHPPAKALHPAEVVLGDDGAVERPEGPCRGWKPRLRNPGKVGGFTQKDMGGYWGLILSKIV